MYPTPVYLEILLYVLILVIKCTPKLAGVPPLGGFMLIAFYEPKVQSPWHYLILRFTKHRLELTQREKFVRKLERDTVQIRKRFRPRINSEPFDKLSHFFLPESSKNY